MIGQLFLPYRRDLPDSLGNALAEDNRAADRFMVGLLFIHWVVAATVMAVSHGTYLLGLVAGGLTFGAAYLAYRLLPGHVISRSVIAMSLMVFSAIFIQQHLGRIEMHFHIFAALAFLLRYRDGVPVVVAVLTTALHHLVFNYCQVYGVELFGAKLMVFNYGTGLDIVLLHAAWVLVEAAVLMVILRDQMTQFASSQGIASAVRELQQRQDLRIRVDSRGVGADTDAVREFNALMGNLDELFRNWGDKAGQLAGSGEQLAAIGEELKARADDSGSQVDQVAHSTQEVNRVVQEVAENINSVSEAASTSKATTQRGMDSVSDASQRIHQLSGSAHRVDEIVASIESIAKKTDLLALNAAIEAANAGEQGKGFAVVADEVRKLADQTSQATAQVNGILADLRDQSDASVAAMERLTAVMQEVQTGIDQTDQVANQIAAAAEELAATMGETADNVGGIRDNVQKVTSLVADTEGSAQELGQMAATLQASVAGYTTSSG
jgi:methyl-accepting chemotaxis protein